ICLQLLLKGKIQLRFSYMSLKLYSEQYNSSSKRKEEFADMSKVHTVGSNGLLDFDSEYQELWDWLIDMESIVMDSHDLMMSEEQQQHLYKRYNVEMSIRHPKKMELLSKVEALKKSGVLLPNDLLEKVDSINEKWELLGVFAFLLLFVGYVYIFVICFMLLYSSHF
uniref:Uncharacterized protein n=1 Tax=Zosterops lateralis melanops TaxID=1220523 RepID=A0A8D2NW26_ZOSLA